MNCWRAQAENVVASLSTGDPVVVMGRIYTREYVANEVTRASYEIDAEAVGPDLSRGTSVFTRRRREAFAPVQTDADGTPSDLSAQFGPGSPAEYDSADLEGSVEVAGSRLVGAS